MKQFPGFYFDEKRAVDLICMGRVAVDLYAEQTGLDLKDVVSFKKYLGGVCWEYCCWSCPIRIKKPDVFLCWLR
jgi:hypothetical protein